MHTSLWDRMGYTQGAERVGRCAHRAAFHDLPEIMANWGGPNGLEGGQCDTHLQERQKGGSGKL